MQTTTTPLTSSTATAARHAQTVAAIDNAVAEALGQTVLTQGRCVDRLLDLYNLTPSRIVRAAVAHAIDDIHRLSSVHANGFVDELRMIAAVEEVEFAFSPAA